MLIAGVDEAGRGALIGDVVAAAVILPKEYNINRLTDSKKLTERIRFELEQQIKDCAVAYSIASATAEEVDKLNIHHASLLAMQRAIQTLPIQPDNVWVDGKFIPDIPYSCQAFVKGDSLYPEISAASILAKTHRDRQMLELDSIYPNYGFAQHKGYPTQFHVAAIKEYGVLDGYRKTYKTIHTLLSQPLL